jgi:hypothetical protein
MQSATNVVTESICNKWIWSTWLKEQQPPRIKYKRFKYMEFVEDETKRLEIESVLARLLYEYHTHSPVNINLLRHLRYPLLASALSSSFDQRPRDENMRSGNLIEILACELAKNTKYDVPILRLQYNPNRDQSMKGDDMLGFRFTDRKDSVLVGEGKFRSSFEAKAVEEAYDGLKATTRSGPLSMEFIAAILSRGGDTIKAAKIMQLRKKIILKDEQVMQRYLLFLGTIGRPRNPFNDLEDFVGELLPGLVAVNVVFKAGLKEWLDRVYCQEYTR